MAKLSTGIHKAISLQLRVMYDGIIAEGVPDRLAAILTTPDGDPAVLSALSLVT
jgi:Anti-sigma factor NepR